MYFQCRRLAAGLPAVAHVPPERARGGRAARARAALAPRRHTRLRPLRGCRHCLRVIIAYYYYN